MKALILLTFIGILWLISSRRWRHRFLKPIAILTVLYVGVTSPPGISLITQGLTAPLPPDPGEPVDSIVVLGRGEGLRNRRVAIVERLWRDKRSTRIFASGTLDAEFIIEQLKNNGVAAQALSGEHCSRTTEENALFTATVLRPQRVQKILLVTDPPHLLRAMLLFRSTGFTVVPHASPLPSYWNPEHSLPILLREYAGLIEYAVTNRFRQSSAAAPNNPPLDVVMKLKKQNCEL